VRHRDTTTAIHAIPDDNAPVAPAHRPTRWTVRRVRSIAFVLFGLAVAASLASVYLTYQIAQDSAAQSAAVDRRLTVLEDDLADRTRQRDAERDAAAARAEQDRELFRARFCEVLAELSATFPNLDPVEAALHCPPAAAPKTPAGKASPPAPSGRRPAPAASHAPSPRPAATPTTAPAAPAPPSAPPTRPGLICGLLPPLC
jgi:hypothetical protein